MRAIVLIYSLSLVYAVVRYAVFAPKNWANLPVFIANKGLAMAAALCFAAAFYIQSRARSPLTLASDPLPAAPESAAARPELPGSFPAASQAQEHQPHTRGAPSATLPHALPHTSSDAALLLRAGLCGVIAHVPISLAILTPAYFKEFFHAAALPEAGNPASLLGPRLTFAGESVFLFGGLTLAAFFLLARPTLSAQTRWWGSLLAMLALLAHAGAMGYSRGLNVSAAHAYLPPMWLLSMLGALAAIVFLVRSRPTMARRGDSPKRTGAQ